MLFPTLRSVDLRVGTLSLLTLLGSLVASCKEPPRLPVGAACSADGECESELCVMEPFVGATCKDPCGGNDSNCPSGQRCSGRAAGYVAYCEPAPLPE